MITTHKAVKFATLVAAIALVALAIYFSVPQQTRANVMGFFRTSSVDGVATTTLAYMTAGTATTTKYYDTGSGNNFAADSAVLALQLTGSSTATTAKVEFEFANTPTSGANCRTSPDACDWFKDSTVGEFPGISTTTQAANIATPNSFTLPFASTTVGGAVGNSARTTRLLTVPTYTRYIRAVITLIPGSLNGAVWAEFVGKKQNQ